MEKTESHIDKIQLAQFISTKFFHDFAGSLGAILNGANFLNDTRGSVQGRSKNLIKDASEHIIKTLELYREMYGYTKVNSKANLDEIKRLIGKYFSSNNIKDSDTNNKATVTNSSNIITNNIKVKKIKFTLDDKFLHVTGVFICTNTVKLLMCVIIFAQEALIYGGEINVKIYKTNKNKKTKIVVKVTGTNLKIDLEQHSILTGRNLTYPITVSNVHAYYTYYLKEILKVSITYKQSKSENQVNYIIEQ